MCSAYRFLFKGLRPPVDVLLEGLDRLTDRFVWKCYTLALAAYIGFSFAPLFYLWLKLLLGINVG